MQILREKKITISILTRIQYIFMRYSHVKRRPFKTYLYTIFGVLLFSLFSGSNILMWLPDVQQKSATYS